MENEFNFEEMLESSFKKLDTLFEPGEEIHGIIVSHDEEYAYIDAGSKQEAIADIKEFTEEQIKEKAEITGYIVRAQSSRLEVTSSIGKGFTSPQLLSACKSSSIPVFGKITGEKDAGYDVSVGEIRGFCPKSQISPAAITESRESGNPYIQFILLEYSKRNCILSHRAVKDQERDLLAENLKDEIKTGDICSGSVFRTETYGVFVRLDNGLEGLVPRKEVSRSKTTDPQSFPIGSAVNVEILTLDWENNKHSFSIKNTTEDPWDHIDSYETGAEAHGTVTGMIRDGAFVELEPGLEGFIHVSRMSNIKKIHRAEDVLSIGQEVSYEIIGIDRNRKRISLELITDEINPWKQSDSYTGRTFTSSVVKTIPAGLIVQIEGGLEVFVPSRELDKDISAYQSGSECTIAVIEMDGSKKRALGSMKRVSELEEQEHIKSFISSQSDTTETSTSSLGSMFGSLLSQVKDQVKEHDQT